MITEQSIYLDEKKILKGENFGILVLNQFILKLKNKPILLSVQPYLTAKDKIRGKMDQKGAGLKQPVMLNIQKMPPRVNFEIKSEPQALIGNRHRVDVYISKD